MTTTTTAAGPALFVPPTPRQVEVVQLLADGLTDQAIARRLGVSITTVYRHVQELRERLGACNRTQAVALAFRYRILPVDEES